MQNYLQGTPDIEDLALRGHIFDQQVPIGYHLDVSLVKSGSSSAGSTHRQTTFSAMSSTAVGGISPIGLWCLPLATVLFRGTHDRAHQLSESVRREQAKSALHMAALKKTQRTLVKYHAILGSLCASLYSQSALGAAALMIRFQPLLWALLSNCKNRHVINTLIVCFEVLEHCCDHKFLEKVLARALRASVGIDPLLHTKVQK